MILSVSLFYYCTKNNEPITTTSVDNLVQEGQQTCTCSYSGFWNSCSVTCPVVDGVCLAHCGGASTGLWPFNIVVATCGCGSAGAGASSAFLSDNNVTNLKAVELILQNHNGSPHVNDVIEKINLLISYQGLESHADKIIPLINDIIELIDVMDLSIREELATLLQ